MNNYIYVAEGEDKDQTGLLIPRYRATGRISPSGEKYKEVKKVDEDDLVPVRSIVTKTTGNLEEVTPDLISTDRFPDFTDGAAIGLSFATSMTEGTTQGLMALKHGGHERKLSDGIYLYAPADCEVEESGKWLLVKLKGGTVKKYLRPDNIVMMGNETKFKKGDIICCAYYSVSPAIKVKNLTKLLGAACTSGVQYFEKDTLIVSQCYAPEDGVLEYVETSAGNVKITVGGKEIGYNSNCMYYYPSGTRVKKFQRICSGVADMPYYASIFPNDVQSLYTIFRKQFYSIVVDDFGDYTKEEALPGNSIPEEMVELTFRALISGKVSPTKKKLEDIQYFGTTTAAKKNGSFFRMISFQDASAAVKRAIKGEAEFTNDLMTETVLGLLLNSNL